MMLPFGSFVDLTIAENVCSAVDADRSHNEKGMTDTIKVMLGSVGEGLRVLD